MYQSSLIKNNRVLLIYIRFQALARKGIDLFQKDNTNFLSGFKIHSYAVCKVYAKVKMHKRMSIHKHLLYD